MRQPVLYVNKSFICQWRGSGVATWFYTEKRVVSRPLVLSEPAIPPIWHEGYHNRLHAQCTVELSRGSNSSLPYGIVISRVRAAVTRIYCSKQTI